MAYQPANAPSRLARDVISNVALGAGATTTYDVEVSGTDYIVVQGDLTAGALGDLIITVQPFEDDGVTLSAIALPVTTVVANILSGGHAYGYGEYDVRGIGRVRVIWKNNNAGAQTLTRGSWRTRGL